VGAMDEQILTTLARRKIHTFSMASGEGGGTGRRLGWGGVGYEGQRRGQAGARSR
jgi:hypothetical protein